MLRLIKLWRLGGRDLRLLWFALRHERRPTWLLPAAVGLGLYALEPLNFGLPPLGFLDDFVLLPLLLHMLLRLLPAEIHAQFSRRRPGGDPGAQQRRDRGNLGQAYAVRLQKAQRGPWTIERHKL